MPDIFSPENLAKSVHQTLDEATAAIPDGKRVAVLVDATQDQVHVMLAMRAGDHWRLSGTAGWDGAHVAGRIAVAGSW